MGLVLLLGVLLFILGVHWNDLTLVYSFICDELAGFGAILFFGSATDTTGQVDPQCIDV